MSKSNASNLGKKVLAFLAGHELDPTPLNYRFGYSYLTQSSTVIVEETNYYIDNNMRMKQQTVDDILAKHGATADDREERIVEKDEAVSKFIEKAIALTMETRDSASGMSGEMAEQSRLISEGAQGEDLAACVTTIVQQAQATERKMACAYNQIDRLQRDLEEAQNRAYVDELTGIANRRSVHNTMTDLQDQKIKFSLAIVDIDYFKKINDNWGHQVGDRALHLVATHLAENLKDCTVSRWGGEEFLIVFEGPNHLKLAERLTEVKDDLKSRQVKVRETDEPLGEITFSAGVALCDACTFDDALNYADELLYSAKRAGRNRVFAQDRDDHQANLKLAA